MRLNFHARLNAFGGERWKCECGHCSGEIVGDFFSLEPERQRLYLPYAPRFIQREYRLRNASHRLAARRANDTLESIGGSTVPRSIDRLTRAVDRWRITLGEPYPDVYPGNLVYRCTLPDGTPAVIKTEPERSSDDEFPSGIDALVLYAGRGLVRVLDAARDERVVLMELVVPGETLWHAPIGRALEAVASVMAKLRRAPLDQHSFPDVRAYHRAWPNHVRLYGGPGLIDADLFDIGQRLFLELCDSSAAHVVLHGDLNYGNVLSSHREEWLAIDPKGVAGEPCYEVGASFRNRVDELYESGDPVQAMRWRVEALAEPTGFDRERIRLWAALSQAVLSEVWSADNPSRPSHIDMRAARLLHEIGLLG